MLTIQTQVPPLQVDEDGIWRVGGTRVTLDTIVRAFNQGHTAEEIASHYPAVPLADIYAVIAYYLNHQEDVQRYLQQQTVEIEQLWATIEATPDYQQFRKHLLARRATQKAQ